MCTQIQERESALHASLRAAQVRLLGCLPPREMFKHEQQILPTDLVGRLALAEDLGLALIGDQTGEYVVSCVLPDGVAGQYEHCDVGSVVFEIDRVPVKGKRVRFAPMFLLLVAHTVRACALAELRAGVGAAGWRRGVAHAGQARLHAHPPAPKQRSGRHGNALGHHPAALDHAGAAHVSLEPARLQRRLQHRHARRLAARLPGPSSSSPG
eukprot:1025936-Rhodomonas_salina.2